MFEHELLSDCKSSGYSGAESRCGRPAEDLRPIKAWWGEVSLNTNQLRTAPRNKRSTRKTHAYEPLLCEGLCNNNQIKIFTPDLFVWIKLNPHNKQTNSFWFGMWIQANLKKPVYAVIFLLDFRTLSLIFLEICFGMWILTIYIFESTDPTNHNILLEFFCGLILNIPF